MPIPCPDEATLREIARGNAAGEHGAEVAAHVSTCERCQREIAALATAAAPLAPATVLPATLPSPKATAPDLDSHLLKPGEKLGRYTVVETIGIGGMGVVYSAYDSQLERHVALKLLRPDSDSLRGERQERLLREAKAMAQLSHPNIVSVYDVGIEGDRLFVAMELVEGSTLRSWLQSSSRTSEVIDMFCQVGHGLSAAHRAGIVHRDFKPENVLIDGAGRPRVTDFGLALPIEARPPPAGSGLGNTPSSMRLTNAGALLGTPAYMAPEQMDGATVDQRSDQFSFCVSFYEGLTGIRPYRGESLLELRAAIKIGRVEEPPRNRRAPSRVLRPLVRGLRPEPGDRFPSVDDLLEAVERGSRRTTGWRRAAIAAVVLACATAVIALVVKRASPAAAAAHLDRQLCLLAAPGLESAEREATWLQLRLASRALESAPGLTPVDGFRVQDRDGWDEQGSAHARAECGRVGAKDAATYRVLSSGALQVSLPQITETLNAFPGASGVSQQAAAMSLWLARQLGVPSAWAPKVERLAPFSKLVMAHAWEEIFHGRYDVAYQEADAALANDPTTEDAYLIRAISGWWVGERRKEEFPKANLIPQGPSRRLDALMHAIIGLSRQDYDEASRNTLDLLEDDRYQNDVFALYVAGESLFHGGRPTDGASYFRRVLALEPHFSPASYHLLRHMLAHGDFNGITRLADVLDRADPGTSEAAAARAGVVLATGRYGEAAVTYLGMVANRPENRNPYVWETMAAFSFGLAGDLESALSLIDRASERLRDFGATADAPEPVAFALCQRANDLPRANTWRDRLRHRLLDHFEKTRNAYRSLYSMAIVDFLSGDRESRARWLGTIPPPPTPEAVQIADFEHVLNAIEGGPIAAGPEASLSVSQLERGLRAERAKDLKTATEALEASLATSRDGEFDCITLAALARIRRAAGDKATAEKDCSRVRAPWVPRPYCLVLARDCAAASP